MKSCFSVLASCLLLLTLSACTSPTEEIQSIDFEGKTQETVGLGQSCGEKRCHAGLECDINLTCVDHVADPNMVCPETQDPVCGHRDGRKNGYLNECEARRHGAGILHKGFCQNDESVIGNCQAVITSIGNCPDLYEGYAFSNGSCQKKTISGCDAEIPFTNREACEAACK